MTTAIDNAMGTAKEALGSAKHVADDAADAVKDTAGEASKNFFKAISFLRHIDVDDVVGLVGLRRKRSSLETIALVGGGVLLGAGIAMLIAPVSGRKARTMIRGFFQDAGNRAKDEALEVQEKAGELTGKVKEKASEVAGEVKEKVGEAKEKVGELVGQAAEGAEGAQAEEGGKGRRRGNQNVQVS